MRLEPDVHSDESDLNTPAQWDETYREEGDGAFVDGGWRDYEDMHDVIVRLIPDASRVLDVGCGTGFLCRRIKQRLPGTTVVGVDFSGYALSRIRERDRDLGIEYILLDVQTDLPSLRREFDAVTLCNVLEHLQRPESALADAVGLLRTDGLLVLLCPHDDEIPDPQRVHNLGHDEVFHLLAPYAESITFTQLPPKLYKRWLMAHLSKERPGP